MTDIHNNVEIDTTSKYFKFNLKDLILQHWSGNYPLVYSYWIVCWFGAIFVYLLLTGLTYLIDEYGESLTYTAWGILIWAISFFCYQIWMAVGTWRSATNYKNTSGKKFWGILAKVVIIFSCIQFANLFSTNIIPYINVTRIYLLGGDTIPEVKTEIIDEGKTLKISGVFSNGSYKKIKAILSNNKEFKRLYLNSNGGRLKESTLIVKIIQQYKLDTYVEETCLSFCTLVFLAGDKRYATPNAKLGFHSPALIEDKELGLKTGIKDESFALYQTFNLPQEFIDKIFATDNENMWYPSFQYLMDIGVVNRMTGGGESNVSGKKFGKTKESIIEYLNSEDFFKKVNTKFPGFFEEVASSALPLLLQGKPDNEVFTAIRLKAQPLMMKAVANSNQKIRLKFASLGRDESEAIAKYGGEICYKFLKAQIDITKVLTAEMVSREIKIYDEALDSEFVKPTNYSKSAVEAVFAEISTKMDPAEVSALDKPDIKNGDLNCFALVSFYKAINAVSTQKQDIIIYELYK